MEHQVPATVPVLPIRNAVLFPTISIPLVVGRARSIRAVNHAEATGGLILVVAQKILTPGDPAAEDLYRIGTLCKIETSTDTETGGRQIVFTGIHRYRVASYQDSEGDFLTARGEGITDIRGSDLVRSEALFYNLKELSKQILQMLPGGTDALVQLIDKVDDATYLTHVCSAYLSLPLFQKQELLETILIDDRMEMLLDFMRKERDVLQLQREIREKMSERLNKAQREALLREQIRTIRSELGEEEMEAGTEELEQKLKEAALPEDAMKQAREELKRLRSLPPASAEYHVIRGYLDLLSVLPWRQPEPTAIDIARARQILDEDHFGLDQVKKRILQFLAVAKLKNDLRGPILCLVGPPGVGKTSLGHSIARALNRKFTRTSLGGVRDEAEIRGHRRTYVAAMPGRIIQSLKRVGTRNPVMMLDEIDKLRADFHGDPSSAMLEVLDPEQNKTFTDHYLDLPFDLSEVFFIATANVLDTIPAALRDRMEIIEVHGYTAIEKLNIAKRFLLPRAIQQHGLKSEQLVFPNESLMRIITHYTREAGVRELQRKVSALMRSVAEELVERDLSSPASNLPIELTPSRLEQILGPEPYYPETAEKQLRPGVAMGLAWTPHGGDLLFIEATPVPGGKGALTLTGQLGDVMKESAQIALTLARAALPYLQKTLDLSSHDIHIHVPSGAIPKDGPSAGATILAALASLILQRPLEPSIAMTGEITLRGAVLPVGGIKEKVLAAHRAGVTNVILPRRNQADLRDVPEDVKQQLNFQFIDSVDELINAVLHVFPMAARRAESSPPAA